MSSASLQLGGDNWAAKDGNLLGYQKSASSSVHIPHEFTFTRGSNLAATRVAANGLIEKGRENLLLQSNQFDTTWQLTTNTSVTSGQAGYDGSNNAWLLTKDDNQYRAVYQDVSVTGVWTLSVYAKSNTLDIITLRDSDSQGRVEFDLSDGSVGSVRTENIIAYDISSVGNDWYRCQVSFSGTTSRIQFYADFNDPTEAGSIYIQDAQLEAGMVATNYIETGASTVKAGILENTPRLDYSGGATEPSLLLEPQRTNYLPYSEYIQGIQTNLSYDYNDVASPENVDNGATLKLAADSSAVRHRQLFSLSTTDGTDYTFSVFFKKADANWIQLMGAGASSVFTTSMWANFDLENGVVGNKGTELIDSGIEDYGNGWYRCYISAQAEATATGYFEILTTNNTDSGRYPSYQNSTALDYVHIYGAQVEEGSYPTSYIPTYGSSVTRDAEDIAINTLDQTYSTDITIFLEVERLVSTSDINKEIAVVINSTTTPNNRFTFYSTNNGRFRALIIDDSGNSDNLYSATNAFEKGETIKVALKITSSGCTLFVDGSSVDTSSGIGGILGIDRISFFRDSIIKQYLMFPTALSDAECITLTTP